MKNATILLSILVFTAWCAFHEHTYGLTTADKEKIAQFRKERCGGHGRYPVVQTVSSLQNYSPCVGCPTPGITQSSFDHVPLEKGRIVLCRIDPHSHMR